MPKEEDPQKVDTKPNIAKKPKAKPKAIKSTVIKPEPAKPTVIKPEPAKPTVIKAEPAKPKAIKSTVIKPASDKAKVTKVAAPAPAEPEPAKPVQKKRNIPKRVKDLSWEKWVGKDVATHACLCCEKAEIRMNSFHCGHVVAEVHGGLTEPDNLRPICADCNLSMGRENFNDFKARCGFNKPIVKPKKPAPKKKKSTAKDDSENKKIINLLINYMEKKL